MEFCPRCQHVVDTRTTFDIEKEIREGEVVMVMWMAYYCNTCQSFLRSIKSECPAAIEETTVTG